MTKSDKAFKAIHPYIDSNIKQSLERSSFRKNASAVIDSEGNMKVWDGKEWLASWEFERTYPELPLIKNNWSNYDRTKNWLQNKKSY